MARTSTGALRPSWLVLIYWVAATAKAEGGGSAVSADTDVWLTVPQQQACNVRCESLSAQPVATRVTSLATVTYDDLRVAKVFSPVSGTVAQILAAPGSRVEVGSPLAVLTSADMAQAKADLARADASLRAAKEGALRQAKLFRQAAASARDVEAARDGLRRAEAERTRAKQQYALLTGGKRTATGQSFTLRSPLAGEVISREASLGGQVQGQYAGAAATPLYVVADLSSVWLLADIQEGQLGAIERGALAKVRVATPPIAAAAQQPLPAALSVAPVGEARDAALPAISGQVDWLADVLDPISHTLKVRCVVDNKDRRLRPNMRVLLDISGKGQAGLRVPSRAIAFLGEQPYALVARSKKPDGSVLFRLTPVSLDDDSKQANDSPAGVTEPAGQRLRLVRAGLTAGAEAVVAGTDCVLAQLAAASTDGRP